MAYFNFKGKLWISQILLCLLNIKHTKSKLIIIWRFSVGSAPRLLGSIFGGGCVPAKGIVGTSSKALVDRKSVV